MNRALPMRCHFAICDDNKLETSWTGTLLSSEAVCFSVLIAGQGKESLEVSSC